MKFYIYLCISLLFIGQVKSQVLSPKLVNSTAIDYKKLAQVDTIVNKYIQNNWLIGTSIIIVKNNSVVYYKGLGFANKANKKQMANDAIYRIMSQTKAITSLAILQLFEKGLLELDQPVSDFITSFKNAVVINSYNPKDTSYTTLPAKRSITIRDLLTHTSGIDYTDIGSSNMGAIYTKAGIPSGLGHTNGNLLEKMNALGKLPLAHQPGEKFTYGLNCDLLGCIVEIVSGLSLEAYFQKNIFTPLGMVDTYFNVPQEKAGRLPTVYAEELNKNIFEWGDMYSKINPRYPLMKHTYFSGGAGLSSTAFDYAIFLQMILNGGKYNGVQVIAKRSAELMLSPQLNFKFNGSDDFGLGFALTAEKSANINMRNKGSFSWGGYFGTKYWADPKEKLIVLVMTQQRNNSHGEIHNKIENIIYSSLR
jgi:CubicO group peptidase (beta-lactamase class C family)